jgi:hypothetical protein
VTQRILVVGAGISIWPNAVAALDDIGLGDAVRESGGRVTALGEPLVVARRSVLTDLLANTLDHGTIESGRAATELVATEKGVRVMLSDGTTLAEAFARFAAIRRPRVRALARESRLIGQMVNLRPAFLGAALMRASALVPEAVLTRHLAWVASGSAFRLPS